MRIIMAPNEITDINRPTIFLAGGITDCPWWQDTIIEMLKPYDSGILLNPRRRNFPIHDPMAAKKQIEWEYYALNNCDIFSMWFSSGESPQPICMYELGRHLALRCSKPETILIGVEKGYKRANDVYIQTRLVNKTIALKISSKLNQHARNILHAVEVSKIVERKRNGG